MLEQLLRSSEPRIVSLNKKRGSRHLNTAFKFVGGEIISRLHSNNKKPFIRVVEKNACSSLPLKSNIVKTEKIERDYSLWKDSIINKIDWTRGRFVGKIVKIEVSNGLITQKTYLTPKGTAITISRSELGLIILLDTIKIKLFN